jgi:electron transport complex protein RnfC
MPLLKKKQQKLKLKLKKTLKIINKYRMKTFKIGGIHPPENKFSAQKPIEKFDIPKKVTIPISQHLGVPAKIAVKKGEEVKVGQLLAKGEAFISANIHSPVSGKVFKISEEIDATGFRKEAIIINVEGDEWLDDIDTSDDIIRDISMSPEEIVKRIQDHGIVGMGGATFPSHVKYMVPEGKKAEYLIINGVECEPYLTTDHRLMLEKAEEMLIGIQIMMKALKVNKAIIGIENNKPDAIEHIQKLLPKFQGITVEGLKVQYPQGGEKQLIDALLKRQVPSGKLPLDVNCVVNNVATAFAVYEAVQKNKPLVERIVTVTGKTVRKPSNFLVRIGTPAIDLINAAEGDLENTGKVVSGGPMTGKALTDLNVPITKGFSGILLIHKKESKRLEPVNCIRCGKCTSICPMGLEPHYLTIVARQGNYEACEIDKILDCIECGSCNYICPSNRPLLDYIRLGKAKTGEMIRNRSKK